MFFLSSLARFAARGCIKISLIDSQNLHGCLGADCPDCPQPGSLLAALLVDPLQELLAPMHIVVNLGQT